ncbi:MAG: hypothetical protein AB1488_07730 [Nitrospirota bacterium]
MSEEDIKIIIGEDRMTTRGRVFEGKAHFHKEQARLPFEEKIKILVKLQELASGIKGKDRTIWKV